MAVRCGRATLTSGERSAFRRGLKRWSGADWVRPLGLGRLSGGSGRKQHARIGSSDDRSGFVTGQRYNAAVAVAAERPL